MGFGAIGPIPWTAINEYAHVYQFDEEQTEALFDYIRRLDLVMIERSKPKADGKPSKRVVTKRGAR